MSMPNPEQPIRTRCVKSGSMWCETCGSKTVAISTTTRFYRNGIQVEVQKCSECKYTQETEYYTGPTTRIKNKEQR